MTDEYPMTLALRVWHKLYCRWYDNRAKGHKIRMAFWGWCADIAVKFT